MRAAKKASSAAALVPVAQPTSDVTYPAGVERIDHAHGGDGAGGIVSLGAVGIGWATTAGFSGSTTGGTATVVDGSAASTEVGTATAVVDGTVVDRATVDLDAAGDVEAVETLPDDVGSFEVAGPAPRSTPPAEAKTSTTTMANTAARPPTATTSRGRRRARRTIVDITRRARASPPATVTMARVR
jgi:hypothetical protein